jgi:hypothetical protein
MAYDYTEDLSWRGQLPEWGIGGSSYNRAFPSRGVSTSPGTDWTKVGTLLAQGGSLFGGDQGPQFKDYKWMTYPGAGGLPQMSPWSDQAYSNWQNLMAKQGMVGGYDPAATYRIFSEQVMPGLETAASRASKSYQDLLLEQAKKMMAPAMESVFAGLAGGSGEMSGYGQQQMTAAATQLADQYSRAGAEAQLGLLGNWSNIAAQQLPQQYQQMWQMFAEPQWVAPVAVPEYTNKEQGWLAKMLQGGLQGAGIGTAISPGWGSLIGAGIGALGSLLT